MEERTASPWMAKGRNTVLQAKVEDSEGIQEQQIIKYNWSAIGLHRKVRTKIRKEHSLQHIQEINIKSSDSALKISIKGFQAKMT